MMHPIDIMLSAGIYPSEFNGVPVQYYPGSVGAAASQKGGLASLISQFTGGKPATQSPAPTQPAASESWRRQLPTDNTQLQRQLSANAGEMGMPGGYVGGIVNPAFRTDGPQLPAINNPDMRTYGRMPGYGEATFYRQSMQGGMAPIAAMSPLGVPKDWKPGSTPTAPATPPATPKPTTPAASPKPTAKPVTPPVRPRPGSQRPTSFTPPRPPAQVPSQPLAPDARQQLIDYLTTILR